MPLLLDLLDDPITFRISEAADVLADIGPHASAALPRLRGHLTHCYEWVRVPCATVGDRRRSRSAGRPGRPAAGHGPKNPATANTVVACLDRMGTLAVPALPLSATTWPASWADRIRALSDGSGEARLIRDDW